MSNYIEYNGRVAFHPGFYIEEIVEESGLTQQDFAYRLDTTPKTLSKLINGQQGLSVDIAMKLSKLLGTSVDYWLNLQTSYDSVIAEINSESLLVKETLVLKMLGYGYFRDYFSLPDIPRKVADQVVAVRKFLQVSSLTVLQKPDLAVNFRSASSSMDEKTICKANALVQIAFNCAREVEAPAYNKKTFVSAVDFALSQTTNHEGFYQLIKDAFLKAGVILVVLPNLEGSKINGATKKIGSSIMLMVNDRRLYADSFWFTLLHEAGHILNGDFGASFDNDTGSKELAADDFAQKRLIPDNDYRCFTSQHDFTVSSIEKFARHINRDPGIVLGRLQHDGLVRFNDLSLRSLRRKYKVVS